MSQDTESACNREFLLYWSGFLVAVFGAASVLWSISSLLMDVLSYGCWYPYISPALGIAEPSGTTGGTVGFDMPFRCVNPAIALIRFVFDFLTSLLVAGAGSYMMLNGKRK